MAQIQYGTCAVAHGSQRVIAAAGVDWSDARSALAYGSPVSFSVQGDAEIPYQVTVVTAPANSLSGFWEVTLISNYTGATNAAAAYIIHKDFSRNLGLPHVTPGDNQTAQLITRAFETIDQFAIPNAGKGARVHNSAAISVPQNVLTALTFNTEDFDTDDMHDLVANPGRLTCKTAGTYIIIGVAEFPTGGSGDRSIFLRLNGIQFYIGGDSRGQAVNLPTTLCATAIWSFAVNDYVELMALHNWNAALNVSHASYYSPMLAAIRIPLTGGLVQLAPVTGAPQFLAIPISGTLIGATTIAVSLGLSNPPNIPSLPWFEKAAPGDANIEVVSIDSITAAGFNVNLAAPAVAGQVLHVSYYTT